MKRKVLVAVDESESAHEAARFVRGLFGDGSVEVLGINVAERPPQWVTPGLGYGVVFPAFPAVTDTGELASDRDIREAAHQNAAHVLADAGLEEAAPVGAVGDPVAAIVSAAEEHDVDLIVVGGDDAGFFGRLFDRSVARALLHDARRPVLVVPMPETDAD